MIFDYPIQRSHRRHGPAGYSQYESYREWLRDEFCFRCIYCLKREAWGRVSGDFELDHFEPQAVKPDLALSYDNLVYACRTCNAIKGASAVADPFQNLQSSNLQSSNLRCDFDGRLIPTTDDANRLIQVLDLNSRRAIDWRLMWMRIVSMASEHDASLFEMLVGFPRDLPNLKRKRPPTNSRPEGVAESWFDKQKQGKLPVVY